MATNVLNELAEHQNEFNLIPYSLSGSQTHCIGNPFDSNDIIQFFPSFNHERIRDLKGDCSSSRQDFIL